MVTGTVTTRWRANRNRRRAATAATSLSDALGVLVAELHAGAHPADAVQAAADTQTGGPADVVRALGSAAPDHLRSWLNRLALAWALADRYGIPLAELLDAIRGDTEHRARFNTEVQARLAGPRATAMMLAGLPLLGLALGQALGAAPGRVLCQTPVGQVLLVIGTGLACAGVQWSARLVSGAVSA
jgi:tight adherence protein B